MAKRKESSVRGAQAGKNNVATRRREIDFSDIPELTEEDFARMRPGRRPVGAKPRKAISIRIDPDVLDWLRVTARKKDKPYQSLINEILGRAMRRAG